MSAAALAPAPFAAVPSRKPLPGTANAYPSGVTGNDQIYTRQPSHAHTRTASSSIMPNPQSTMSYANYDSQRNGQHAARRTLSNATSSSTASSTTTQNLAAVNRAPTNTSYYASSIRRSTSSRSQQQATSYVALLRRQKATVWCDRAQHEDPRVLAQQRQAKMRATMEVVGGVNPASRTSTSSGGGVRSKIRHHGAVKASAFQGQNMAGAGVPMRLSASEVDDNDSDDDRLRATRYARTGSGRSSLSSGHRASMPVIGGPPMQRSSGSLDTPPSRNSYSPVDHGSLRRASAADETPVPSSNISIQDYFAARTATGTGAGTSGGSASSEERGFGGMSDLPQRREGDEVQPKRKTSDELRRRGSVDDRTMTMSAGRLFVANPDLSD